MIKTGIGYDVHKLVDGTNLIIGGIEIPSNFTSLGHSDGDALIHAIIDSLLGAACLGDIGKYFPSNNKKWEGVQSSYFLKQTIKKIEEINLTILHIDSTVILEKPFISNYTAKISDHLSTIMRIKQNQISVKATTTDGLGFWGSSRGWSALAIATLSQKTNEKS